MNITPTQTQITRILTVSCANGPGLVAAISSAIRDMSGNISESQQFDDRANNKFMMRITFAAPKEADSSGLHGVLQELDATWTLRDAAQPKKAVILVSAFPHCLQDLLFRIRVGEMKMDVVAVISNHDLDPIEWPGVPAERFHYLPVTKQTKNDQEAKIRQIVADADADLVILARYMQILSDDLTAFLAGRCINIHHSFLPGFKGAKPYHQAFERGVKMVGATAHFVTADLDEGPIISQGVEPISHAHSPQDLVGIGRDIERRVLAEAVQAFLQDRILINGDKTVVFRR